MSITFRFLPFQTNEAGQAASAKLGELMAELLLEMTEYQAVPELKIVTIFDRAAEHQLCVSNIGYQIATGTNVLTAIDGTEAEEAQLTAEHPEWSSVRATDSRREWAGKAAEEGARAEALFIEHAGASSVLRTTIRPDANGEYLQAVKRLAAEWGEYVKEAIIEQANDVTTNGYFMVSF